MAIDNFSFELLSLLDSLNPRKDNFAMLGRQHLTATKSGLSRISSVSSLEEDFDRLFLEGSGFADPFIRRLGYQTVESIDFSDYEQCSLLHDFNQPIPLDWHERYDVVFDGGTLEHVFNFPVAIANAINLTKEGGYFIACAPSNNYNGHGFYQFSPELFFRIFHRSMGFEIHLMSLIQTIGRPACYRVDDPCDLGGRITFGGSGPMQLFMIAQRKEATPCFDLAPFQSDYESTWTEKEKTGNSQGETPLPSERPSRNRAMKLVRTLLPERILSQYDYYRWLQRRKRQSLRGVHRVKSLSECFLPVREQGN